MEKYICPNKDKCKDDCDHKCPHSLHSTCNYTCRVNSTGPYREVKCRLLTPEEEIIIDY